MAAKQKMLIRNKKNISYIRTTNNAIGIQWNLCNMDTLGQTKSILIIMVLQFSRSAYILEHYFGMLAESVDYAGVLVFKCPD